MGVKVLFAMDKQSIMQYKGAFDSVATYIKSDNGKEQVEVWFARDLQKVLIFMAIKTVLLKSLRLLSSTVCSGYCS